MRFFGMYVLVLMAYCISFFEINRSGNKIGLVKSASQK